jgi:hypothetical protein
MSQPSTPCILRILRRTIETQVKLARVLAEPQFQDISHRKQILDETLLAAAEFNRLVPDFQLQIEPRKKQPAKKHD